MRKEGGESERTRSLDLIEVMIPPPIVKQGRLNRKKRNRKRK